MGPFSFLNGAFLAALAAAALPVLIHLLSRRQAREVPFAQLRFLDEITRRKVRRMRLRQWLLLALRTLAIAFLALTLSRPVWHGPGGARHRGSSTVAILIDDSFSMETRLDPQALLPVGGEGGSADRPQRYSEARRRAREVTDLLTEGDRAILVFAGSPLRVPYESTVRDAALLTEELTRAGTRPVRADLAGALERVQPLLAGAKTINREVFVISDFQKNQAEEMLHELGARTQTGKPAGEARVGGASGAGKGDVGAGDSTRASDGRPQLPIPQGTRVYRVPLAAEATPNVAITGASYEANPDAAGGRLTVRMQNHGDAAVSELPVQALEGDERGRLLADGFVSLEPQAYGQTVLTLTETPAAGRLAVRAAGDALARDDLRYVSTAAASRVRVLVVTGGEIDEEAVAAEARLPLLALDPWRETGRGSASEPALFDVQTIPEADLGLAGRIDADVVLLLNVGRLSAAAGELLESFRTEGGGIFVALGDRVDPRLYNTQVLPRLGASRLENIEGDTDPATHFTLRPAVTGHEIFEGFPITPGGTLTGAQFQRIVGVRPGAQARVLASFSGERPALVEEPGVLIFASSLDLKWSDFATSAAYLPFLHRSLLYLSRGGRASRGDLLVGQRLSVPLPPEGGGERYRFVGPAGLEVPQAITQTERGPLLVSEPVPEPGFYTLRRDSGAEGGADRAAADAVGGGATLQTFAVNVDTRESALAPMTAEEGELLYGAESVVIAPDGEIAREVLETRYGRELWRLCLAIAFGLLVIESFVSRGRVLA
jgi:hypothetical protein